MIRRRPALAAAIALVACGLSASVAAAAVPVVSYSLSGVTGANDWYTSDVTVSWRVDFRDATPVSSSGCEAAVAVTTETTGTTRTCSATNADGTTTVVTKVIKIDKTPPDVAAGVPSRPPDAGDWYRRPVDIVWSGTDAISGVAACTSLTYSGPDGPGAPAGTCTDAAGNVSAPLPFGLRYDATPPGLADVTALGGDTVATVRWQASADATVVVTRSPGVGRAPASIVYRGAGGRYEDTALSNRARYAYTVTATDAAGNATSITAVAQTGSWLRGPRPGARMSQPPLLRWRSVKGASYYNVQLYRGTEKVLSAWPGRAHLRLHRIWRSAGRRQRLVPGIYTWFVWPGYGRRTLQNYGRLLGSRRFAVERRGA